MTGRLSGKYVTVNTWDGFPKLGTNTFLLSIGTVDCLKQYVQSEPLAFFSRLLEKKKSLGINDKVSPHSLIRVFKIHFIINTLIGCVDVVPYFSGVSID